MTKVAGAGGCSLVVLGILFATDYDSKFSTLVHEIFIRIGPALS
jgi:hypothetical protein